MSDSSSDHEIEALQRAYDQLALLDQDGRKRALDYLYDRLIDNPGAAPPSPQGNHE